MALAAAAALAMSPVHPTGWVLALVTATASALTGQRASWQYGTVLALRHRCQAAIAAFAWAGVAVTVAAAFAALCACGGTALYSVSKSAAMAAPGITRAASLSVAAVSCF